MDTSGSAARNFLRRRHRLHDGHNRRWAMKYMLMICDDEPVILSLAEVHAMPQIRAWYAEVDARGIRRGGARLRPSSDAATARVRDGEMLVSDGPFAETKEQVGGFDIVECVSLDEAVEIASRHPSAASGAISRSGHCGRSESEDHDTDHTLMNT
jgi:hypothetical protein